MKKLFLYIFLILMWCNVGFTKENSLMKSIEEVDKANLSLIKITEIDNVNRQDIAFMVGVRCVGLFTFVSKEFLNTLDSETYDEEEAKIIKETLADYDYGSAIHFNSSHAALVRVYDYTFEKSKNLLINEIKKWENKYRKIAEKNLDNLDDMWVGGYIKEDLNLCQKETIIADSTISSIERKNEILNKWKLVSDNILKK